MSRQTGLFRALMFLTCLADANVVVAQDVSPELGQPPFQAMGFGDIDYARRPPPATNSMPQARAVENTG